MPAWKKAILGTATALLLLGACEAVLTVLRVSTVADREDPFRGFSGQVAVFEEDPANGVYTSDRPANRSTFNPQSFLIEKPANGFRVFCLGGSSAYGYPWGAEAAFPAILSKLLQATWRERRFEVVNAAGVSYGSHRMRILARELLGYQPDLLVLYEGHNEFIEKGFFRALQRKAEALGWIQPILSHSRLYGALDAVVDRLRPAEPAQASLSPMEAEQVDLVVRRDADTPLSDAELRDFEGFFRENITAICRMAVPAGVQVVLCTTPANVRDWKAFRAPGTPAFPPGAENLARKWSQHLKQAELMLAAGQAQAALEQAELALELAPRDPPTHHLLGQVHERLGQPAQARAAYQRACEVDSRMWRATPGINQAVREIAAAEGAILVDVERLFEEASPDGLVGFNLIEDYVHPTREGHERIALALWEALRAAGLPAPPPPDLDAAACADRVLDEHRATDVAALNTPTYVYNQGVILCNQQRYADAARKFEEAIRLVPTAPHAHRSLADVLLALGDVERAAGHYEQANAVDPHPESVAGSHLKLGMAWLQAGQAEQAEAALRESLRVRPHQPEAHQLLAAALEQQGDWRGAAIQYAKILRLQPDNAEAARQFKAARARMPAGVDPEESP